MAPEHLLRTDLGGALPSGRGQCLLALVHISDAHVMDAASPARCEWVELLAHDPRWRGLLHMHRPQEALTHFALAAHVDRLRADPRAPHSKRLYDLALCTGDNIDNAQRNELDMFLALMAGGKAHLSAQGCVQQASSELGPGPWPFWCPDPSVDDPWKARGYPAMDGFIERVSASLHCAGLGLPWASLPGNHDLMRQGTALVEPDIEGIALGGNKLLCQPEGLDAGDLPNLFVDAPARFSQHAVVPHGVGGGAGGSSGAVGSGASAAPGVRRVQALAKRRAVSKREWLQAHVASGALGYGARHAREGCADAVIDLANARLILLDTNHPAGDYQGSIGARQLAWLEERLAEVDREQGRIAIVASHHGSAMLVNRRPSANSGIDAMDGGERLHAKAMVSALHRHPSVVAWLTGHRHVHRVKAHAPPPGGAGRGFWEITTASIIDWPSQTRAIEFIRRKDGMMEICCTLQDHGAAPGSLAALHWDLAQRFAQDIGPRHARSLQGNQGDRDVRLLLPARR